MPDRPPPERVHSRAPAPTPWRRRRWRRVLALAIFAGWLAVAYSNAERLRLTPAAARAQR